MATRKPSGIIVCIILTAALCWRVLIFGNTNLTPTEISEASDTSRAFDRNKIIKNIQNCWTDLLITSFVTVKLHHKFTEISKQNNHTCPNIHTLTKDMIESLQDYSHSQQTINYHNLLKLRRTIMLLSSVLNITKYSEILALFAKIEYEYIETYRNYYPIFNIHPPRSAGTFICQWFKSAQKMQQKQKGQSINALPLQRPIRPYPIAKSNCNAGKASQFAPNYRQKPASKSCKKQYKMTLDYYTMLAREAPLHNNKNAHIAHPLLCDKFVYVLVIRSPIERILSWFTHSTTYERYDRNSSQWSFIHKMDLYSIMPGFYASLFGNYSNNHSRIFEVISHETEQSIRMSARGMWLRPYSSNAVTKWIGYEWNNASSVSGHHEQGLFVSSEEFKELYFYNAINLLLQIDYVLNFASFEHDMSAIKATTDASDISENEMFWKWTQIANENKSNIWTVFAQGMNRHFNVRNIFTFQNSESVNGGKYGQRLADYLTENDWRALYKANYFDFRLYLFAKYIAQMDVQYYNRYLT